MGAGFEQDTVQRREHLARTRHSLLFAKDSIRMATKEELSLTEPVRDDWTEKEKVFGEPAAPKAVAEATACTG